MGRITSVLFVFAGRLIILHLRLLSSVTTIKYICICRHAGSWTSGIVCSGTNYPTTAW